MRIAPSTTVTEKQVVAALGSASIRQLAAALDPGAFKGEHGRDGFTCPDCDSWSARILDGWRWECVGSCTDLSAFFQPSPPKRTTTAGQRTRLGLAHRVADRFDACVRLVELVKTGSGAA